MLTLMSHHCSRCSRGWVSTSFDDACAYCGKLLSEAGRVPAAPFVDWFRARRFSASRVAAAMGREESWLRHAHTFDERDVELAGIVLEDNPRLTEELYPQLAEVV